jgi:hypothetical protein
MALIVVLAVAGCDQPPESSAPSSASQQAVQGDNAGTAVASSWDDIISSSPEGAVAARTPLRVVFSRPVVDSSRVGDVLHGVVEVFPALPLSVTFASETELVIAHPEALARDREYRFTVNPVALAGVSKELEPFAFTVTALQQDFSLQIGGLQPAPEGAGMTLSGEVRIADASDPARVEKTLQALQGDRDLDVQWRHADPLTHHFTITGIMQRQSRDEVRLRWDASGVGADDQGQHRVPVPGLGRFAVTAVRAVESPSQYVEVTFSQALDRKQNLNGLLQIDGKAVNVDVDHSRLRLYPSTELSGEVAVSLSAGIRSVRGQQIQKPSSHTLFFSMEKPGVRFVGSTSILPPGDVLTVPIEAASINAVQVSAYRVYPENMLQYLQNHDLDSGSAERETGKVVWTRTLHLPDSRKDGWQRHNLDLGPVMAQNPGSIVMLSLTVKPEHSVYSCAEGVEGGSQTEGQDFADRSLLKDGQLPGWYRQYYLSSGRLTYSERDNPCNAAYYHYSKQVRTSRSFFVSNLGVIAKSAGDGRYHVVVTDLRNGTPRKNVRVDALSYQKQVLQSVITDKDGMAKLEGAPGTHVIVAQSDGDRAYLRVPENKALPVSHFDTGGVRVSRGIKGFVYGERDVWRPGDTIYLMFILADDNDQLPDDYPVTVDLFDSRGNKVASRTNSQPLNGFYRFDLDTAEDAPTGNWRAVVKVGGQFFDKSLKVETIVPNRLDVQLSVPVEQIRVDQMPVRTEVFAEWLNGAKANGLKADVEVVLRPASTRFEGFEGFQFDDPARAWRVQEERAFEGELDASGRAEFAFSMAPNSPPPGMLDAIFTTRVFEKGGNFSTAIRRIGMAPYASLAGVSIEAGKGWGGAIARDADHPVMLAAVDAAGVPLPGHDLSVEVYRLDWRWWWDQGSDNLARYVSGRQSQRVAEATLRTNEQGRVMWKLAANAYEWGRHLVRVCDTASGHCAGQVVYLGWSSGGNAEGAQSATQLMLSPDKKRYQVGEEAVIQLPAIAEGRLLLSLESGSKVLRHGWVDLAKDVREIRVPITADMAPNVYAHAMLILPQARNATQAPLRLYGIAPLLVDDPDTRLEPVISVPETVRPGSTLAVKVSESRGKAMQYSVAVVDEGLLGITGYHAPDPHQALYRREALGVLTWDLFDQVVGGYGATLDSLVAIGGSDSAAGDDESARRNRRFPPVVKVLGPFRVDAGQQASHAVTLPEYMGRLRVMVVAGDNGAYGASETSVKVTQPLTILATLPRVLGPGESLDLPITVFANADGLGEATVSVTGSEHFQLPQETRTVQISEPGDTVVTLPIRMAMQVGKGQLTVSVDNGTESASQTVHIDIRAPNLPSVRRMAKTLAPGEEWRAPFSAHGIAGTNEAVLEVSSMPPLNLEERLSYLIRYPHGCVEQTTSSAFPQLFLKPLLGLSGTRAQEAEANVRSAIKRLASFQTGTGALSYWPGDSHVNHWANVYAGHFLVLARAEGYVVPSYLFDNWLAFQQGQASVLADSSAGGAAVSAYRLYVLALAGKANVAAMNRLREQLTTADSTGELPANGMSRWLLALAYRQAGLADVAAQLVDARSAVADTPYQRYTYGSALRDQALRLLLLNDIGATELAWQQARDISAALSQESWYSTHSTAWALLAMSRFAVANNAGGELAVSFREGDTDWQAMASQTPMLQQALDPQSLQGNDYSVRNDSSGTLFVGMVNRGIPAQGTEQPVAEGMQMAVTFTDMAGEPLDVSALPQGQDFIAEVTVRMHEQRRQRIADIALSMVMPSGWQIRNERLAGAALPEGLDYQDIRDDRVYSYFSLWRDYYWYGRYQARDHQVQTVKVVLNASYAGRFYLPGWRAAAMYDETVEAANVGRWVEVVAQ